MLGKQPAKKLSSVLDQTRKEGYDKGRQDEKDHQAQLSMIRSDDEYERGREEERAERPSRLTWFMVGVGATIMTILIVYLLTAR